MKKFITLFFIIMSVVTYANDARVVRVSDSDNKTVGYRVKVENSDGVTILSSRTYGSYTRAKKVADKYNDSQEEEGDGE